ncbi:MAG: hypothetical protein V9E83_01550 [Baekduia sp.]
MRVFMIESPTTLTAENTVPDWWSEVQQGRDDLGGSRIESWLDEEIDFAPRPKRFARQVEIAERPVAQQARRFDRSPSEARVLEALVELGDDVELVSEPARRGLTGSFDVIVDEHGTLTAAEPLVATAPATAEAALLAPPVSERPTVRITGHPEQGSRALRRRDRTLMELIGPQPDRIAFWIVILGITLIALSRLSA